MSDFRSELEKTVDYFIDNWHTAHFIDAIEALHQKHSVPDEPTMPMMVAGAGWREYDSDNYKLTAEGNMVYRIYKSMIAAAKEESK